MQLPKNTVPSDSNFLAPFFPAAGKSSADAEALTSRSRSSGEGKFDELFDGLKPSPKHAAAQTPSDYANLGLAVCPMPSTPPPTAEAEVMVEAELDGADTPSDADAHTVCGGRQAGATLVNGQAVGHATRDARTAVRTAKELARANDASDREQDAHADGSAPAATREANQPNEHASAVAFQTPRFTGLPEAALEHRSANTLPPGLTRLMGIHSPAALPASTPEANSSSVDSADTQPVAGISTADEAGAPGSEFSGMDGSAHNSTTTVPTIPASAVVAGDGSDIDASLGLEATEAEALLADEALDSDLNGAANVAHAYGRDLGQTRQSRRDAHDPLSPDTPVTDVNHRGQLSPELAQRLNRVSPKRDFSEVSQMSARIAEALEGDFVEAENGAVKSFVPSEGESVANGRRHVGTDVAKPDADMFSRFLPTSAQPAASDHSVAAVSTLEKAPDVSHASETLPLETVSTAHEAVEVVLRTVDHASSQEQKSVNLRFSVGDVDLSVRVELQASQVRTTFRTDSAELRAALSQEWEVLASNQPGERTLKLVPAFVTASEQSAMNSSSGDTSSRQRDPRAEREAGERSVRVTSKSRGPVIATPVASSNAGHAGVAPLTSRRLHTVA